MRVALRYDLLRFSLCSADLWERFVLGLLAPISPPPPLQIPPLPQIIEYPPPHCAYQLQLYAPSLLIV